MLAVQFGLTIEQFWSMTWCDFVIYATAHERQELNEWNRTRKIVYCIYCSIPNDGKPKISESEFFPLPGDEKPVPASREEINRMMSILTSPKKE